MHLGMNWGMTWRMAWRNIWRHVRRSVITMSAVAFATAVLIFSLSLQWGSYETMITTAARTRSGHFQVQAPGYQEDGDIRQIVDDPAWVERIMAAAPGVAAVTSRAEGFAIAATDSRSAGVWVTGIRPDTEALVTTLPALVRQGRYLDPAEPDGVLVGHWLARRLRVDLGEEITLLGQARDGSVAAGIGRVTGVIESGQDDMDRNLVFVGLPWFQEFWRMEGGVHRVVARCERLLDVPRAVAAVRAEVENRRWVVLDWRHLMPGLAESILLDLSGGLIFYLLLLLVVAFGILNTFLMAVLERTREFGVLMALGASKGRLARLILMESTMLTGIGLAAGMALGAAVTLWFQKHGIAIEGAADLLASYGMPERLHPRLAPITLAAGPLLVVLVTFWAVLVPLLRLGRLRLLEALYHA